MNKLFLNTALLAALVSSATGVKANSPIFEVRIDGSRLIWGDATWGYLQVQNSRTHQTLCELEVFTVASMIGGSRDDTACTLQRGEYDIINHTTGQRINRVPVGYRNGTLLAPRLEFTDNSWTPFNPYQVIQPNTIFTAESQLSAPSNLSAQTYSATAAEVFWDRPSVPNLNYDIYLNDQLIDNTNGTSYFFAGLDFSSAINIDVVARNANGASSSEATISLSTTPGNSAGNAPAAPTGLRAEVYSANTIELFWDRQGNGQLYELYDENDELIGSTDGTSYFLPELTVQEATVFMLRAVSATGVRSEPSPIYVPLEPANNGQAITLANAEDVLRQAVRIANRESFEAFEREFRAASDLVSSAATDVITRELRPENNIAYIEGTAGGSDNINFSGINGGEYTCNAGGSATALSVLGGENGQGRVIQFNQCAVLGAEFFGQTRQSPVGRSGIYSESFNNAQIVRGDVNYFYDAERVVERPFRNTGQINDTLSVSNYYAFDTDLEVTRFESTIDSRVGIAFPRDPSAMGPPIPSRNASSVIMFSYLFPNAFSHLFDVFIDLRYNGDPTATDPVDLWNAGSITVTASDGSQLIAQSVDLDNDANFESIQLSVGNEQITRPVTDGFLVSCRRADLGECNVTN